MTDTTTTRKFEKVLVCDEVFKDDRESNYCSVCRCSIYRKVGTLGSVARCTAKGCGRYVHTECLKRSTSNQCAKCKKENKFYTAFYVDKVSTSADEWMTILEQQPAKKPHQERRSSSQDAIAKPAALTTNHHESSVPAAAAAPIVCPTKNSPPAATSPSVSTKICPAAAPRGPTKKYKYPTAATAPRVPTAATATATAPSVTTTRAASVPKNNHHPVAAISSFARTKDVSVPKQNSSSAPTSTPNASTRLSNAQPPQKPEPMEGVEIQDSEPTEIVMLDQDDNDEDDVKPPAVKKQKTQDDFLDPYAQAVNELDASTSSTNNDNHQNKDDIEVLLVVNGTSKEPPKDSKKHHPGAPGSLWQNPLASLARAGSNLVNALTSRQQRQRGKKVHSDAESDPEDDEGARYAADVARKKSYNIFDTPARRPTTRGAAKQTTVLETMINLCAINTDEPAIISLDRAAFDPSAASMDHPYPVYATSFLRDNPNDIILQIEGPDPQKGHAPLKNRQLVKLATQGELVSGDVTTCYLAMLSRTFSRDGLSFKTTGDFVWTDLKNTAAEKRGNWKEVWQSIVQKRGRRKFHYNLMDDTEAITALQLFEGNYEAGHFACVIVDRTIVPSGIFTFFDSGKEYRFTNMAMMKKCFEDIGFANEHSIWINAKVPHQAYGSNDCGVWMCMFIATFLRSMKKRRSPNGNLPYRKVAIRITPKTIQNENTWFEVDGSLSTQLVGWVGRAHIGESLFQNDVLYETSRCLSLLECQID